MPNISIKQIIQARITTDIRLNNMGKKTKMKFKTEGRHYR